MKPYREKLGIKSWAEADRPREKLLLKGRRQLTDAELIAILIGSGNKDETAVDLSRRMLATYNNDLDKLGRVTVKELSKFKGIGEAKAIAIVAALEIGRRRKDTAEKEVVRITSSTEAFEVLLPVFADLDHEEFWILMLNHANCVIGKQSISSGGLAGTIADPKIIFKIALEHNASYVILAHNHPSGNLTPSEQDIDITKKLALAGSLLDLQVLDHLIVTNKLYYSFGDEGLI
jgi:DNA repair protein RadC